MWAGWRRTGVLEVTCLGLETEGGTTEDGRLTSLCSPPRLRTRGAAVTWWAGTETQPPSELSPED